MKHIKIAIDGPAGAGKSTVAKALAKKLQIEYVDTGAMYRAIALKIVRKEIDVNDEAAVLNLLNDTTCDFQHGSIILDGEYVEQFIRNDKISSMVTPVSQIAGVRSWLVERQREIAKNKSVVMDGRDIGTVVLKDADLKIYLDAGLDVRAKRRYDQLYGTQNHMEAEDVLEDIKRRDKADMSNKISPLKKADDAVLIDSSQLSLSDVLDKICELIPKK